MDSSKRLEDKPATYTASLEEFGVGSTLTLSMAVYDRLDNGEHVHLYHSITGSDLNEMYSLIKSKLTLKLKNIKETHDKYGIKPKNLEGGE